MGTEVLILGRDASFFADNLAPQFPDVVFFAAKRLADAIAACASFDVVVARDHEIGEHLIKAMPRLRWIQALTTGTDVIESLPGLPPEVIVTAARGFHGAQMSELAVLFMLALARNFPAMLADQRQRRWERRPQRLLQEKTVALVGVGRIAEEIARRCKVFGMTVIGFSARRSGAPDFDAVYPRERLTEAVADADFLIVLVPASKETHHLVGAAVLDAMKPSSVLINLARGAVVDEAALIEALSAGKIAGAALDVFETEPLPADNPLWGLSNVIISPHVGGMSDIYAEQALPLVIENLRAFTAGTPALMRYIVRGRTA